MFTGIIEEIGSVERLERSEGLLRLQINSPKNSTELRIGDSVALNGVCLTVVNQTGSDFTVEVVEETLKKTTCDLLGIHDKVNIELPLKFSDRLGGHVVLGHVDTIGEIVSIEQRDNSWMFRVSYPKEFSKYLIPVGSVAIDGISLTVAELNDNIMGLSIIPHTMEQTILKLKQVGSHVNIEFDILGKYILKMYEDQGARFDEKFLLTEKHLRDLGY